MEGVTKLMLSFLFALFLFEIDVQATKFEYCSDSNDYELKVHDVKISPEPIDYKKPWTISVTASSKDREFHCANKKLEVIVGFDGQVSNLCEKVSKVEESTFVISHTVPPSDSDPIYVLLAITNGDDSPDVVVCVRVDLYEKPPIENENGHIFLPSNSQV